MNKQYKPKWFKTPFDHLKYTLVRDLDQCKKIKIDEDLISKSPPFRERLHPAGKSGWRNLLSMMLSSCFFGTGTLMPGSPREWAKAVSRVCTTLCIRRKSTTAGKESSIATLDTTCSTSLLAPKLHNAIFSLVVGAGAFGCHVDFVHRNLFSHQ